MSNIIKKYLKERKNAANVSYIIHTGEAINLVADEMGTKKIFKPSEYEIDEFINKCINAKQNLIKVIHDVEIKDKVVIPNEIIEYIKKLEIKKLIDCKKVGDVYFKVGNIIRKQKKINSLLMPMGPMIRINLLEGSSLMGAIFLVLLLKNNFS